MNIVISEFMDAAAVDVLRQRFDVVYDPELVDRPDALRAALPGAHAWIVRNRSQVDESMLAIAPALKVVGRLGVGLDNIAVQACQSRNIAVIPAVGANAQAVAEYVIATSMMLLRRSYASSSDVANGRWPRAELSQGRETAGKTLGLVGFGGIGQLVAKLARALGMEIVAYDPAIPDNASLWQDSGAKPMPLDDLLGEADVVSLHVPLLDSTRKLFDAQRLRRMKQGAILINTARGGIVDEPALAQVLVSGHLGGAALDVYEDEPLPAGTALSGIPSLILTPHVAGVTNESNQRVSWLIADRVSAYLQQ
ncbi:hydroxyacid dehydrogenase [Allopusillimonas ginsengisoli]|uniref:hydroxyacid dehydrogenase n=1 Tax=Allopusillimonas ginsengisoli TaxID=453575 RepID=UPI001021AC75|nr:hydroxyacid dehydrogenase [Allopusillimonas ginsengisoli]TEA77887.1 hydroxyacid dehydrogenase [Allopusillimonas ginsengisoli]